MAQLISGIRACVMFGLAVFLLKRSKTFLSYRSFSRLDAEEMISDIQGYSILRDCVQAAGGYEHAGGCYFESIAFRHRQQKYNQRN